mmetsp:Transcript_25045/g.47202  ORF Transcript_25045/g.47202 Transcript_25045/m.47202 type:complete len:220 (+) Transcript_25045:1149-1808(+)
MKERENIWGAVVWIQLFPRFAVWLRAHTERTLLARANEVLEVAMVHIRHHEPVALAVVDEGWRAHGGDAEVRNAFHRLQDLDLSQHLPVLLRDQLHGHKGIRSVLAEHLALVDLAERALPELRDNLQLRCPFSRKLLQPQNFLVLCQTRGRGKKERQVRTLHDRVDATGIVGLVPPRCCSSVVHFRCQGHLVFVVDQACAVGGDDEGCDGKTEASRHEC